MRMIPNDQNFQLMPTNFYQRTAKVFVNGIMCPLFDYLVVIKCQVFCRGENCGEWFSFKVASLAQGSVTCSLKSLLVKQV